MKGATAAEFRAIELLRDGRSITIRAQRPDDRADLQEAYGRMGAQSRYYRFFTPKQDFSEAEAARFMNVDFVNHVALVAVLEIAGAPHIVGAGRYMVAAPGTAEVAFGVDDPHQGLGIASALFRHLAAIAGDARLVSLEAEVLADNTPMLKVFEKSGLAMSTKREHGVVHVTLRLH